MSHSESLQHQKDSSEDPDDRPMFRVNNRTYLSAGVLFCTMSDSGTVYFLMQKVKGKPWQYEDFGGKSQKGDLTIKDVAFRECIEELNGCITRDFLDNLQCIEYLVPYNKYIAYLVLLPSEFMKTDLSIFGENEVGENGKDSWNLERNVVWVTYEDLWNMHPSSVHPRLQPDLKHWLPLLLTEAEFF